LRRAPDNPERHFANLAPPGNYLLFIVTTNGVPSMASIIHFKKNNLDRVSGALVHLTCQRKLPPSWMGIYLPVPIANMVYLGILD
jgi:hypothetical protein